MNKVYSIVPLVAAHGKTAAADEVLPEGGAVSAEYVENGETAAAAVESSMAEQRGIGSVPAKQHATPHRPDVPIYLEHFGLHEAPFRITPHTDFFFPGADRSSILDALIYAVTYDEGIVKVSGEVGSGKTMLCRMLLRKLPSDVITVYLANPSLSRDEIFLSLAAELGLARDRHDRRDRRDRHNPRHVLRTLQKYLLQCYGEGKKVVILIDEAHTMPDATLEEIRLLSNLESDRHKLVHIVLFGQPELDFQLAQRHMRPLRERITHNFALEAVRGEEVARYLEFRLRAAGYRGGAVFMPAALKLIHSASEGLLRRVNIIADKALLAAFAHGVRGVDARLARRAIRDAEFLPLRTQPFLRRHWAWLTAIGLSAAAVGTAAFFAAGIYFPAPSQVPVPVPVSVPSAVPSAVPSSAVVIPSALGDQHSGNDAPVGTSSLSEPAPASVAASEVSLSSVAVSNPPSDEPALDPELLQGLGPHTVEFLRRSQAWLNEAPSSHYFLQIMRKDSRRSDEVERFLADTAELPFDQSLLRVYRSRLSGQDRIGIIYGDYPSQEAALAAVATLPKEIRVRNPYPRTVGMLR